MIIQNGLESYEKERQKDNLLVNSSLMTLREMTKPKFSPQKIIMVNKLCIYMYMYIKYIGTACEGRSRWHRRAQERFF